MRSKMTTGAVCLIGAAAFAACQPSPSPTTEATVTGSVKLDAPQNVAKVAVANVAPKKAVATATAGANTPDVTRATAQSDEPLFTTVTGCLLRDDGVFQLKDTEGEHAPKTRSWKSGFIRKGSATIDLVDGADRLRLGPHVGYRVTVSGTLSDREMHARSMKATPDRCD